MDDEGCRGMMEFWMFTSDSLKGARVQESKKSGFAGSRWDGIGWISKGSIDDVYYYYLNCVGYMNSVHLRRSSSPLAYVSVVVGTYHSKSS